MTYYLTIDNKERDEYEMCLRSANPQKLLDYIVEHKISNYWSISNEPMDCASEEEVNTYYFDLDEQHSGVKQ